MDVVMPQLGETVTEGTITRWFKQVGDAIEADEPLFEVSTDKVDSEVPAPESGVLREILVPEGETVDVGVRLAVIGGAAAGAGDGKAETPMEPGDEPPGEPAPAAPEPAPAAPEPAPAAPEPASVAPAPASVAPEPAPAAPEPASVAPAPASAAPEPGGALPAGVVVSPVVRRLLNEHGLDPATITGTGEGGRITRNDALAAARARRPQEPPAPVPAPAAPAAPRPGGDEIVPFDNIRRRTAEHMVRSKATSAHVYTSIEVDFDRVERTRRAAGEEWRAREGFGLTYLPFIVRAICAVLADYPHVNASVDGERLVVHRDVNLGIAVDLDFHGLVAPVVRAADGKRLRLLAREMRDLGARARAKKLSPDELAGGTFTITNMGPFGTHMTLPIINQPQVAILATDGIAKRPVALEGPDGEDTIAVHPTGFLTLTWDHRAFDGAYAGSFLAAVREVLEHRDWDAELD